MDRGRLAKTHRKKTFLLQKLGCVQRRGREGLDKEDICRVARSAPVALLTPPHRNHTMH